MAKIGDIVTQATEILVDTDGDRYTPTQLVELVNDAIRDIRRVRPDAFIGNYGDPLPAYTIADLDEDWPLDDQFVTAVIDYVAARASYRDDEFVEDARAITLNREFIRKLTT